MKRVHWLGFVGFLVVVGGAAFGMALLYEQSFAVEEVRIQAITARALDENYLPVEPTGEFLPDDVLSLSVRVENAPAYSIVSARWYFDDTVITTQDQAIGDLSPVFTLGFELQRTDQRWPLGLYHVEVMLNNVVVGTAEFSVVEALD